MSWNINPDLVINKSKIELKEQFAKGSYGEVWKGKYGDIEVAVKKITTYVASPQTVNNMEKEINIAAMLRHPNVVSLFGASLLSSTEIWLVMEYADGGNLHDVLVSSASLSWAARWKWAKDAATAVSFLHERGILHRDIKSPNFLIVGGALKIADFGMSAIAAIASAVSATATGESRIGTLRWLAPECTDKRPVFNEKTDVYALGIVFWEIASRAIPFSSAEHGAQVVYLVKHQNARPEIPDSCPPAFAELIEKCWHQDPNVRPTTDQILGVLEVKALELKSWTKQNLSPEYLEPKKPDAVYATFGALLSSVPVESSVLRYPLLLWVDDKVNNRLLQIANRDMNVELFNGFEGFKQWINSNLVILENNAEQRVRIITYNVRRDEFHYAGEEVIRFIRGQRSEIPVLVYCGNVLYARYVNNYTNCSVTSSPDVCRQFMAGLVRTNKIADINDLLPQLTPSQFQKLVLLTRERLYHNRLLAAYTDTDISEEKDDPVADLSTILDNMQQKIYIDEQPLETSLSSQSDSQESTNHLATVGKKSEPVLEQLPPT